jgi:hypothetical protein
MKRRITGRFGPRGLSPAAAFVRRDPRLCALAALVLGPALWLALAIGQTAGTGSVAGVPEDRAGWLVRGEALLAAGQPEAALDAFERASQMQHAADAEIGIVRSHMQAGEYRRALNFASHAAGAHRDHPEAAALYAWLLYRGGETAAAGRYVAQGLQAAPGDAELRWVESWLPVREGEAKRGTNASDPTAAVKRAEQRPDWLGPETSGVAVARNARVVGTGVLFPNGDRAWVPLATLAGARTIWLRNGLGRTAAAEVTRLMPRLGVAMLTLRTPLNVHTVLPAAREPFPGSPGAMVEYEPGSVPRAEWPMLHQGFLGRSLQPPSARALGIGAPPGPRGGPVFDRNGRLAGIAMALPGEPDRLISWTDLALAAEPTEPATEAGPGLTLPTKALAVDAVYESALRVAVQVLVVD